jgi:hypothetical protein
VEASLHIYWEGYGTMNVVANETLMKFGLIKDKNNSKLKEIFKNNSKLKEVHIDIYPDNPLVASSEPFMLLLRTIENNVITLTDEDRLIFQRNDGYGTYFINILFSKIADSYYKTSEDFFEFILNIQNIYYRITVLN